MSVGIITLVALLVVVLISCVTQKLNPGLLALFAALLVGNFFTDYSANQIVSAFPISLFVLLVSMSLVFGVAQQNGTLTELTVRAIKVIKGHSELLPLFIFVLAFIFSAIGPGNITAVALLAPLAMALAKQQKVSVLIIAIMLCTGANAGAFSPFAPTGVVAIGLLEKIGVHTQLIWTVFIASAVLQTLSALFAYALFLLRRKKNTNIEELQHQPPKVSTKFTSKQKITIFFICLLLMGVMLFQIPLILMAVVTAVFLFVFNTAEEEDVIKTVPWSTILMVSGIAVLIGLMEKTGGLDIATSFIAQNTSVSIINAVLAFVSGLVSAFSSSSGVVLPAFIPLIPGLATKMALTNLIPLVIAVAVGSHMVDVSPLSTLGALSIAAVDDITQRNRLFRWLLIWGMTMSAVAGILAFIFLDLLY